MDVVPQLIPDLFLRRGFGVCLRQQQLRFARVTIAKVLTNVHIPLYLRRFSELSSANNVLALATWNASLA